MAILERITTNTSMMRYIILILTITLFITTYIKPINSIYCWQCNSAKDRFCTDVPSEIPENKDDLDDCYKKMYRLCPSEGDRLNYTFCRKQVQTIDQETRVIRACGYVRAPQDCYWTKNPPASTLVCQCDGDGCNHALANVHINHIISFILPVTLTVLFFKSFQ